ncbi:MAG: hypothetical protein HYY28_08175 [Betaproteobacteria bacterium]|nr:hypothetical protein [Betaproteobacteria bacterium]MBI2960274.1 hypothetical protein [Betaproteobacteria bacterium]
MKTKVDSRAVWRPRLFNVLARRSAGRAARRCFLALLAMTFFAVAAPATAARSKAKLVNGPRQVAAVQPAPRPDRLDKPILLKPRKHGLSRTAAKR